MHTIRLTTTALLLALGLAGLGGCQSHRADPSPQADSQSPVAASQSNPTGDPRPVAVPGGPPLAFIGNQPVTMQDLFPRLLQNHGGEALAELVLDQMLQRRLAEAGVTVSQEMVDAERANLLAELSSDPDQAVRLLQELRKSRGLTQARFRQTLWRNAAMRRLVRDEVQVTPAQVRQAYEMQYGEQLEARIITAPSLGEIQSILLQLKQGKSFIDLAVAHSTDPSSVQGGLLAPLSHADASYPAAIRNVLVAMEVGQVSHPVAIEHGYAVLKLERKIAAVDVKLDDVKDALTLGVRRQQEQIQMRQLARTLLGQAQVTVLDPTLKEGWDRQVDQMQTP